MGGFFLADGVELLVATCVFSDPLLGKLAGLDLLELLLHALLHRGINDLRTNADVAPFGGFRNRETHARDALLVHQVDDELELVQALEISHFRLITGFDENLESGLHQSRGTAAEHDLLAEKVGDGFFAEVGFKHTGTGASDSTGPCERGLLGLAGNILMNGD